MNGPGSARHKQDMMWRKHMFEATTGINAVLKG